MLSVYEIFMKVSGPLAALLLGDNDEEIKANKQTSSMVTLAPGSSGLTAYRCVTLLVICSTATPMLQRMPNEIQKPRLLSSASWKRVLHEQQGPQQRRHARHARSTALGPPSASIGPASLDSSK